MKRVTLTIGHNVDGTPYWSTKAVADVAADYLALAGHTVTPCMGCWMTEPREDSTRIDVTTTEDDAARIIAAVPGLAYELMQCEVYAETCTVQASSIPALSIAA